MDSVEYNGYMIEPTGTGMYEIKPIGRGTVIKELRGLYTKIGLAMQAIDLFESRVKAKRKRNESRNRSSRD